MTTYTQDEVDQAIQRAESDLRKTHRAELAQQETDLRAAFAKDIAKTEKVVEKTVTDKLTALHQSLLDTANDERDDAVDKERAADADFQKMKHQLGIANVEIGDLKNQIRALQRKAGNSPGSTSTPASSSATPRYTLGGASLGGATAVRPLPSTLTYHGAEAEDWLSFKDKFITAVELNGYNDAQAKLGLKLCMKSNASRAIATIDHKNNKNTIGDVLQQYEDIFMNASASEIAINKFESAQQQPAESILAFHSRVAALFLRAYPDNQHQPRMAVRVFGEGLRKQKVKEAVLRDPKTDFRQALLLAEAEHALYLRLYPGAANGASGYEAPKVIRTTDHNDGVNEVTSSTECYGCGGYGHIRSECRRSSPRNKNAAINKTERSSSRPRSRSKDRSRKPVKAGKTRPKFFRRVSAMDSDNEDHFEGDDSEEESSGGDSGHHGNTTDYECAPSEGESISGSESEEEDFHQG